MKHMLNSYIRTYELITWFIDGAIEYLFIWITNYTIQ